MPVIDLDSLPFTDNDDVYTSKRILEWEEKIIKQTNKYSAGNSRHRILDCLICGNIGSPFFWSNVIFNLQVVCFLYPNPEQALQKYALN